MLERAVKLSQIFMFVMIGLTFFTIPLFEIRHPNLHSLDALQAANIDLIEGEIQEKFLACRLEQERIQTMLSQLSPNGPN